MEILHENHCYPFGMKMEGKWAPQIGKENMYGYNEMEFNGDFGLNWNNYGARFYDPATARWGQIDPLGEIMTSHTPYSYVFNNPVSFNDPTGMMGESSTVLESRHVDVTGEVIGEYDDGDNNTYVHDVGTTKDDVDSERERTGRTSGGGDNARGNGRRAVALRYHIAEQYLVQQLHSGQITPEEYLNAFHVLHGNYDMLGLDLLDKHKFELIRFVPGFALLKWGKFLKLSKPQLKAIRSLTNQIRAHKKKLKDFKANPFKYDNKGLLRNAPNDEIRNKIIQGRIKHLEKEIKTFRQNILKIFKGE